MKKASLIHGAFPPGAQVLHWDEHSLCSPRTGPHPHHTQGCWGVVFQKSLEIGAFVAKLLPGIRPTGSKNDPAKTHRRALRGSRICALHRPNSISQTPQTPSPNPLSRISTPYLKSQPHMSDPNPIPRSRCSSPSRGSTSRLNTLNTEIIPDPQSLILYLYSLNPEPSPCTLNHKPYSQNPNLISRTSQAGAGVLLAGRPAAVKLFDYTPVLYAYSNYSTVEYFVARVNEYVGTLIYTDAYAAAGRQTLNLELNPLKSKP